MSVQHKLSLFRKVVFPSAIGNGAPHCCKKKKIKRVIVQTCEALNRKGNGVIWASCPTGRVEADKTDGVSAADRNQADAPIM